MTQQRLVSGVKVIPEKILDQIQDPVSAVEFELIHLIRDWAKEAHRIGAVSIAELPAIEWHEHDGIHAAILKSQVLVPEENDDVPA